MKSTFLVITDLIQWKRRSPTPRKAENPSTKCAIAGISFPPETRTKSAQTAWRGRRLLGSGKPRLLSTLPSLHHCSSEVGGVPRLRLLLGK